MYNKNDLNTILKARDLFETGSALWNQLNVIKSKVLEDIKSSTKETILYYNEEDLNDIPEGFYHTNKLPEAELHLDNRSLLEYANNTKRHPIPYIVIKHGDKFFFILRESGSGEIRLLGKKGMVGGHVGSEGLELGMYRELEEETGITKDMITNLELKGLIKSNDGVDADHLGLIYEVEVSTDKIDAIEEGVLSGIWINKSELAKHYESFESWSRITYDNLLK
jgi:Predicted phosphoesterase (MutT family)